MVLRLFHMLPSNKVFQGLSVWDQHIGIIVRRVFVLQVLQKIAVLQVQLVVQRIEAVISIGMDSRNAGKLASVCGVLYFGSAFAPMQMAPRVPLTLENG